MSNNLTKPRLSVLMPAKNAERTIGLALRSALYALPVNAEVVVLLDACTDETAAVVSRINDSRLRVIKSEAPLGVVQARNTLLSEAKAEIVAVLDSDDICLPWRFKSQLRKMSLGFDFVCSTAIIFGKKLRPFPMLPQVPLNLGPETLPLMLTLRNPVVHSTTMFKKDLALRVGGYEQILPGEDYSLWLKIALGKTRMYRSSMPTILYRFHEKQITATFNSAEIANAKKVFDRMVEALVKDRAYSRSLDSRTKTLFRKSPLAKVEHVGLMGINTRG